MEILKSKLDDSVNFVENLSVGKFESRFVNRADTDYFITYLSSQSGCNQACKMCHLTATRQTKYVNAEVRDYINQAQTVLNYYSETNKNLKKVYFNFMGRGEPLDNPKFTEYNPHIFSKLRDLCKPKTLYPRFNISTIMPKSFENKNLYDVFGDSYHQGNLPFFYYSLYSAEPEFRKKWLPKAMEPELAVKKLIDWQQKTSLIPKIHFSFIEGENDTPSNLRRITYLLKNSGLRFNMNIVRFNSFDAVYKEPSEDKLTSIVEYLRRALEDTCGNIDVIPRVGFDVNASCGMFQN